MILFVDTTQYNKVTYALIDDEVIKKSYQVDPHKSYETLVKFANFLKEFKIPASPAGKLNLKSEIKKIIVCSGPGSFTGVRVGLSHAMALGLGWNVPVVPMPKDKVPKSLINLK